MNVQLSQADKNRLWERLTKLMFAQPVKPVPMTLLLTPAVAAQMEAYCKTNRLTHDDFIKQALKK